MKIAACMPAIYGSSATKSTPANAAAEVQGGRAGARAGAQRPGSGPGLRQPEVAHQRAHARASWKCRMRRGWRRAFARRWLARALYAKPYYRWCMASPMGCRAWSSTATVSLRGANRHRRHGIVEAGDQAGLGAGLKCEALLFKNDSGAREMEGCQLRRGGQGQLRRPRTGRRGRAGISGAAGRGSEDRLVLRSGGQSPRLGEVRAQGRASAGCVQLRGRLGRARGAQRARRGGLRRQLRAGAGIGDQRNGERNGLNRARPARAMPSTCSRRWPSRGRRFDVVIVDPPAFAKRKKDLPKALAAYKRLNQLAMQLIADDGILVSCSCSYHVSAEDLQDAIAKAARAPTSTCRSWKWAARRRITRCIRPSPRPVISKPISVG
jgi:hypothetical protein